MKNKYSTFKQLNKQHILRILRSLRNLETYSNCCKKLSRLIYVVIDEIVTLFVHTLFFVFSIHVQCSICQKIVNVCEIH